MSRTRALTSQTVSRLDGTAIRSIRLAAMMLPLATTATVTHASDEWDSPHDAYRERQQCECRERERQQYEHQRDRQRQEEAASVQRNRAQEYRVAMRLMSRKASSARAMRRRACSRCMKSVRACWWI